MRSMISRAPGTENDIITAAYVNSNDFADIVTSFDLYVYGHTHETRDFMFKNTRVVSNGKGYGPWLPRDPTWDNANFDPSFIIEI
jgi:predicted phosphodiesterase